MPNMKVHIRFPEDKIKEPVIYQIGHEFKVVTNVRRADVRETTGWMDLELIGDSTEIERAIAGLRKKGVICLLYTSPSPRDRTRSRMPSSA